MPHLVLLGDSVLDNGAYTNGEPDVITQVRKQLPAEWEASLCARDGSTTQEIAGQLATLPSNATHLLLSVGGNDAILRADVLDTPVVSSGEAFLLLAEAARDFEMAYRKAVDACLKCKSQLLICTIYHGNFPGPNYQRLVAIALAALNDVIVRVAVEKNLKVIDLRMICTSPADYANPIEPSSIGGRKIARAIVLAVTESGSIGRGAQIVA